MLNFIFYLFAKFYNFTKNLPEKIVDTIFLLTDSNDSSIVFNCFFFSLFPSIDISTNKEVQSK